MDTSDSVPNDLDALLAELAAERAARRQAEARASGAEAMVAHLKLMIAKLEQHRYGASSERGRKLLEQAELQLEELETNTAEEAIAAKSMPSKQAVSSGASGAVSRCVALCRHICRVSVSSFPVRPPAPAVVELSPNWARPSPRPWRACRVNGR